MGRSGKERRSVVSLPFSHHPSSTWGVLILRACLFLLPSFLSSPPFDVDDAGDGQEAITATAAVRNQTEQPKKMTAAYILTHTCFSLFVIINHSNATIWGKI